jgi:hypothetical protein
LSLFPPFIFYDFEISSFVIIDIILCFTAQRLAAQLLGCFRFVVIILAEKLKPHIGVHSLGLCQVSCSRVLGPVLIQSQQFKLLYNIYTFRSCEVNFTSILKGGNNMCAIIVGIALVIGGLSGEYVLKGTNSSIGLVIVGLLVLFYGLISIRKRK